MRRPPQAAAADIAAAAAMVVVATSLECQRKDNITGEGEVGDGCGGSRRGKERWKKEGVEE